MTISTSSDELCWDASFPRLRLEGSGARDFLQGQTSADLNTGQDGLIQSCWLTATGRLRALLEIRLDASGADVLVLAGDSDHVQRGFDQVIFPADRVRLKPTAPQRRLQTLSASKTVLWIEADTDLPMAWSVLEKATPTNLEHWRLTTGWPAEAKEINGETNPFELGLRDWVSLSKGCYLGQETMAKLASSGGVKQQLRCWSCHEALEIGATLQHRGERAGLITSALELSPASGWIGLALVRRQHLEAPVLDGPEGLTLMMQRPQGFQDPPQPMAS